MLLLLDMPWPPALRLNPFRFRDPISGRWIRARYVASYAEIRARYAAAEIIGPPEVRHVAAGGFAPWRR